MSYVMFVSNLRGQITRDLHGKHLVSRFCNLHVTCVGINEEQRRYEEYENLHTKRLSDVTILIEEPTIVDGNERQDNKGK